MSAEKNEPRGMAEIEVAPAAEPPAPAAAEAEPDSDPEYFDEDIRELAETVKDMASNV